MARLTGDDKRSGAWAPDARTCVDYRNRLDGADAKAAGFQIAFRTAFAGLAGVLKGGATMGVSVVLATSGAADRTARLDEVLNAVADCELVVEILLVWQGDPESPFLQTPRPKLRVIVSGTRASCHARNAGARFAGQDWLWFLDDDTVPIGRDYLLRAFEYLRAFQCAFALANVRTSGAVRVAPRVERVIVLDAPAKASLFWEPGLLISRQLFVAHQFDEELGPGCLHASSEGFDLGVRLIAAGSRGLLHANLELDHPPLVVDDSYADKMAFYALGNGLVLIRHRFFGRYAVAVAKAAAKFVMNGALLRRREMSWARVRLLALLLGPLLMPRRPFAVGAAPREVACATAHRGTSG